jgi:uncharacterized Zn ribbon protein
VSEAKRGEPSREVQAGRDDPPTCIKCGDEYSLHDGFEVTDYCDPCAQELVPELVAACEAGLDEVIGLQAYLTTCERSVILANVDTLTYKMNEVRVKIEAALRKARGDCK